MPYKNKKYIALIAAPPARERAYTSLFLALFLSAQEQSIFYCRKYKNSL